MYQSVRSIKGLSLGASVGTHSLGNLRKSGYKVILSSDKILLKKCVRVFTIK